MSGSYSSPFRGRGVDFSEVRLYQPGDDVRSIDWRVTARTGKPHTKLFVEERERPVLFVVDCGASMQFGTQGAFKAVVASRVMALLAWTASKHGDRVGGFLFAGEEHEELKPVGGKRGILKFFNRLIERNRSQLETESTDEHTDFKDLLFRLKRVARPGSLVYFISDFNGLQTKHINLFSQLATHCDLALIHIYDSIERHAPPPGLYRISNGKEEGILNVDKASFPKMLEEQYNERVDILDTLRRQYGVHTFSVATTDNVQKVVRDNLTHKMINAL